MPWKTIHRECGIPFKHYDVTNQIHLGEHHREVQNYLVIYIEEVKFLWKSLTGSVESLHTFISWKPNSVGRRPSRRSTLFLGNVDREGRIQLRNMNREGGIHLKNNYTTSHMLLKDNDREGQFILDIYIEDINFFRKFMGGEYRIHVKTRLQGKLNSFGR